jgi:hypothetical protein
MISATLPYLTDGNPAKFFYEWRSGPPNRARGGRFLVMLRQGQMAWFVHTFGLVPPFEESCL